MTPRTADKTRAEAWSALISFEKRGYWPEGLSERAATAIDELLVAHRTRYRAEMLPEISAPRHPGHDCNNHPVPYRSDGALGHGFECGICGRFLQAG